MKKIALLQSNYIPWKGYFDLIGLVDEFILFDQAQFTHSDWRNRNRIKTSQGLRWLSIPVFHDGKNPKKIRDTRVVDQRWRKKHWRSITQSYGKSPHFNDYRAIFEKLYLDDHSESLSEINYQFIRAICGILKIETPISWSADYEITAGKTERILSICRQAKATDYVTGPAAKNYLDASLFEKAGIALSYIDYSGYREYSQPHGAFEHGVSIIDLLFNTGPHAPDYMKNASR